MNRLDDPMYHNKAAYTRIFPNHIHNEPNKPLDENCGVCVQNEKIRLEEKKKNEK